MTTRRQERVAELLHKEISNLLQFDTSDPRIGFVTVTDVEVSPDLKEMTVYLSLLSGDVKETFAGLKSATPYFRRELARRVNLRNTPDLRFKMDQSLAYSEKIHTILSSLTIPPESDEETPEADQPGLDDEE